MVKYKDQLSGIKLHVNQIQDEGDIITHLFIGFRAKRKIDSVIRFFRMRTFAERTLI